MAVVQIKSTGETVMLAEGASLRGLATRLKTGMGCHQGQCGSCAFRVFEGDENLNTPHASEERTLARIKAPEGARLLCRTKIQEGTVVVGRYDRHEDAFAGLTVPGRGPDSGTDVSAST